MLRQENIAMEGSVMETLTTQFEAKFHRSARVRFVRPVETIGAQVECLRRFVPLGHSKAKFLLQLIFYGSQNKRALSGSIVKRTQTLRKIIARGGFLKKLTIYYI